ncbi:MAG: hypothetical protein MJ182_09625 [Treponema sp.]|nr:hypothetical protein [Treponema sp.]
MTTTSVQWKIFFDSMNSKKMNLLDLGLFMFNALLNVFLAGLNLTEGKSPYNWLLGSIWMVGAFLFFLRLFYNQASLRFCKTLPCTKKLYTKYIWICFEVVNFLAVIEWIIMWIVLGTKGEDVTLFGIMFLFLCVIHLIMSVGMPFTAIILAQENKINTYNGFQKMGTTVKLLFFLFLMLGGFSGIYWISKVLIINISETVLDAGITGGWLLYVCICVLIMSCSLNKLMFNKLYEKYR